MPRAAAKAVPLALWASKLPKLGSVRYQVLSPQKGNPKNKAHIQSDGTYSLGEFGNSCPQPEPRPRPTEAMSVRIPAPVIVRQPREIFTSLSIRHSSPLYFDRTTCRRRCRYLDQRRTQGIHE